MFHELRIEQCVKNFSNDWEERNGAIVNGEGFILSFIYFDDFGDFQRVWVSVFFDSLVIQCSEVRC